MRIAQPICLMASVWCSGSAAAVLVNDPALAGHTSLQCSQNADSQKHSRNRQLSLIEAFQASWTATDSAHGSALRDCWCRRIDTLTGEPSEMQTTHWADNRIQAHFRAVARDGTTGMEIAPGHAWHTGKEPDDAAIDRRKTRAMGTANFWQKSKDVKAKGNDKRNPERTHELVSDGQIAGSVQLEDGQILRGVYISVEERGQYGQVRLLPYNVDKKEFLSGKAIDDSWKTIIMVNGVSETHIMNEYIDRDIQVIKGLVDGVPYNHFTPVEQVAILKNNNIAELESEDDKDNLVVNSFAAVRTRDGNLTAFSPYTVRAASGKEVCFRPTNADSGNPPVRQHPTRMKLDDKGKRTPRE